mgnify:CR=1 FL=1
MLIKPSNYDEIQVNQEFERLELGGHKGVIKSVEEYTSAISGNTSLKIEIDTAADDKQPGYFQKQFDENTNMDKKWSTGGTKYVSLKQDENCIKMLKAFITSVENSNNGFVYDWNKEVDQLKGKKVGLVFGLEEYQNDKGETKTATKLTQFRSIDKVDNAKIPNVRLLNGSYIEYDKYNSNTTTNNSNPFNELDDMVEITDDILD